MCLLDGEVGGHITALSVDFGTEDFTDASGKVTNTPRLIKNIIRLFRIQRNYRVDTKSI